MVKVLLVAGGVASRRFDLDDVGTEIAQDLPAIVPLLVGQVQDPEAFQQRNFFLAHARPPQG
jgi:hypothetical protein